MPVFAGKDAVTLPSGPVTVPSVTVPLEAFPNAIVPSVPEAPSVGVAVNAGLDPARTCPAAPVITMLPVAVVIESGEDAVTTGVPLEVPAVHVGVPAVAWVVIVNAPLVPPSRITSPWVEFACPSVSAPALMFALEFPETAVPLEP